MPTIHSTGTVVNGGVYQLHLSHHYSNPNRQVNAFFYVVGFLVEFPDKSSNINPFLVSFEEEKAINLQQTGYRATCTCPNAGPKGGEGEAFPAGIYMRTVATTLATPADFPLAAIVSF